MKFLVTGAGGQLGHDVMKQLRGRGHECVGTYRRPEASGPAWEPAASCVRLDITDKEAVEAVLTGVRPDAVIHCAAWTDVDLAEDPACRERVWAVNADATRHIAQLCRSLGCKMTYISTDYVFSGRGRSPWRPDCADMAPLNVYGQTKLAGESAVSALLERFFVVRTSWAFGLNGRNFVKTMLSAGKTHNTVRVVNDQIGTPTYTADLARLLADMNETEKFGYYHAVNEGGYVSRYELCREIYRQSGMDTGVIPVTTEEYGQPTAKRPLNSRLDTGKLAEAGFAPLPDWRDAVSRYLRGLRLSDKY